jgi:hypothetical protein
LQPLAIFVSLVVIGTLGSGCVAPPQRDDVNAQLASLAARALSRDFRVAFRLQRDVTICGGRGDYFVGHVEMNDRIRVVDEDGRVQLRDNWVRLDKSYAVDATELFAPYLPLIVNDTCLE